MVCPHAVSAMVSSVTKPAFPNWLSVFWRLVSGSGTPGHVRDQQADRRQ